MLTKIFDSKTLVLEEPQKKERQAMETLLSTNCNKQQLERYVKALTVWLGKYDNIQKKDTEGKTREAKELAEMTKNNASKYATAQGLALILGSKANMQKYVDNMKPALRNLWRHILLNGYVSHEEAKDILGIKGDLYSTSYSYYYYSTDNWNKPEYNWWIKSHMHSANTKSYGYRSYEDFISVQSTIRGIFFKHFFPELLKDNSTKTLPEGNWRTVNLETESYSAFNLFSGLYKQGELTMKKKGVSTADMKRAGKKMALTEFFPDDNNEYRQNIRTFDYLAILSINEHLKTAYKAKKVMSYPDTLADLFKNFEKLDTYLPTLLYPHIKGLRQNQTQWGNHDNLCLEMLEWLKSHPHQWVSINETYMRIVDHGSNGTGNMYTALVYRPEEEQNSADIVNQYSSKSIAANTYAQEFGYAGLQAFAFILASIGIAEIAINEDKSDNGLYITNTRKPSPFTPVEYLRLTPLGRYALGIDKEYAIPEVKKETYFELDPERLIIRSLQNPNPYEQLLRDTAIPISNGRFQTSALSFLTNCRSRDDVEGKISIFKQFISSELPPIWEQFFQQLLQHCNPLQEDKISYRHYTLQPDNRDLVQLVTTDPQLRQMVIRAEGFRILVKLEDIRKFETQLKKHGYLL